jgi:hypothetical protein
MEAGDAKRALTVHPRAALHHAGSGPTQRAGERRAASQGWAETRKHAHRSVFIVEPAAKAEQQPAAAAAAEGAASGPKPAKKRRAG